jgi:hypothetical protein
MAKLLAFSIQLLHKTSLLYTKKMQVLISTLPFLKGVADMPCFIG